MEKWLQAKDDAGRIYYYNSAGAVSWTLPQAALPPAPLAQAQPAPQQQQAPTPWAPVQQQAPPASWAPPPTVVVVHAISASRHALRHAGFLSLCGCCGGTHVEVEVDEERVSTVREDFPCCSSQCCDRAQQAESVEFAHLQSIRGEEGWVPNFTLITLGIFFGILRAWE